MKSHINNDPKKQQRHRHRDVAAEKDEDEVLRECVRLQTQTKAAITRMNQQAHETHAIGVTTVNELQAQRQTVLGICDETDRLQTGLGTTEMLQNKLSRWTLTFNHRRAKRAVRREKKIENRQCERQAMFQNDLSSEQSELQRRLAEAQLRHDDKLAWNDLQNLMIEIRKEETASTASSTETSDFLHVRIATRPNTEVYQTNDMRERLTQVQKEDDEIEHALDGLGYQIEALLGLAKAQQNELRTQEPLLSQVQDEVETAFQKQKVANHRARRFLVGKRRPGPGLQ